MKLDLYRLPPWRAPILFEVLTSEGNFNLNVITDIWHRSRDHCNRREGRTTNEGGPSFSIILGERAKQNDFGDASRI
jgi:hypothetical protein